MTTLSPCPFCGGDAEMDTMQGYRALGSGFIGTRLTIYCTRCTAEIGHCREDVPGIEPGHVIEEWNRRSVIAAHEQARGEDKAREALVELVALKDLRERIESTDLCTYDTADAIDAQELQAEYNHRKPIAWANARAALAGAGESK